MATIKSHTDLAQSKVLAKILKLESADMVYVHTIDLEGDEHYDIDFRNNQPLFEDDICAWSLAALLDVMPKSVRLIGTPKEAYWYCECVNVNDKWYAGFESANNPVDACYEMILKLHELNLL